MLKINMNRVFFLSVSPTPSQSPLLFSCQLPFWLIIFIKIQMSKVIYKHMIVNIRSRQATLTISAKMNILSQIHHFLKNDISSGEIIWWQFEKRCIAHNIVQMESCVILPDWFAGKLGGTHVPQKKVHRSLLWKESRGFSGLGRWGGGW